MKKSTARKGTSQEEDCTVRSAVMELHEVSQGVLEAGVNHPCLRLGQDKCREPREEDWQSIQLVDTEAGSRVSMVVQSHTSREYREQFAPIGRHSIKDVDSISWRGRAENTKMFCLF